MGAGTERFPVSNGLRVNARSPTPAEPCWVWDREGALVLGLFPRGHKFRSAGDTEEANGHL